MQDGKTKFLKHLAPLLTKTKIYAEPFFGGGAVFCYVCDNNLASNLIINDINPEIIHLYQTIKEDDEFSNQVRKLEIDYLQIQDKKKFYYEQRERYWNEPTSSLLYFLMSTSFNGIWQTCMASDGLFGTPFGLGRETDIFIDYRNIQEWQYALQKCEIHCCDFEQIEIPENSLVYCDPPYIDCFTNYSSNFTLEDQVRCFNWCRRLRDEKGCSVILQNKTDDAFFENMITDEQVIYLRDVKHTAGRRLRVNGGFEARKVDEMIISFGGRGDRTE